MALTTDNKASRLFKALMGVSETKTTRDFFEEPLRSSPAVLPSQIWKYGSWLPTGSASDLAGANAILAIQALTTDQQIYSVQIDESTTAPLVKRWIKRQLTMVDAGTNNAFKLLDGNGDPIKNIIPFNFGDGTSYNYSLYKSDGTTPIAFGIGDWVFDPNSGVITFYNIAALTGVDATHPPCLSFFQYIGGVGVPDTVAGFEGAVLSVSGYNGGANTSGWSDANLDNAVNTAVNKVQANFLSLHGWKGDDTHEGVAVAFQKIVPLIYSHSKDPVKTGFGSEAAEVMTVMSRRGAQVGLSNITGLTIDFLSQGIPTGSTVQVKYNSGSLSLSLDSGASWGPAVSGVNTLLTQAGVKIKSGSEFILLRRIPGILPVGAGDVLDTLTVIDTVTRVGLIYWSTEANEYMPYVNLDASSQFDFGFPVVMKLGKIPPSFKLGSMSSGGFSDVITPQYYGTRPTSVIAAVQDTETANNTPNPDGSDYLVSNTTGGFLNDVLTQIYNSNPDFVGEVILRSGRYKINQDITLSGKSGLKIKSESRGAAIIDSNGGTRIINIQAGSVANETFFNDVIFSGTFTFNVAKTGTAPATLFMRGVVGPAVSINVADSCGLSVDDCGTLYDITITGSGTNVARRLGCGALHTVTLNGTGVTLQGSSITTLTGQGGGTGNVIAACQIGTLTSLSEDNQYIGNSITTFGGAVTDKFKMLPQKFEIIDSDGVTRRWTGFAGPIVWDNTAKQFKLSYDTTIMAIDGQGRLTVNASANLISFNNAGVLRADGTAVTATTVQAALADIYLKKADLDSGGKIALSQLPDALTGGGMTYKGMWSFDAHSGAYPTAEDIVTMGGVGTVPASGLQPGWFILIAAAPDAANPAGPQTAVDAVVYTAGDWSIWNGSNWQRIDNSFADPSYAILPSTPPDGQWTDGLLALGGTTIVEATDQINEILAKLAPPKPVNLSTMTLALTGVSPYSAAESGSGTVRTISVVDSVRPAATTPTGTDSITTLFYDGESGNLIAYVDGANAGSKTLSALSDTGTFGSLVITADNDPWAGTAGKQNFWKGLRAQIAPTADLALGVHNYHLTHSSSGSTPDLTFYVDNPAATMSITGASISAYPPMSKYLSGVPSVQPSAQFGISGFTAVGVVGKFYNSTKVAAVACNVSGVSTQNLAASVVPAAPVDGSYGDATVANITVVMPASAYSEAINFTLTPFNTKAVAGTTTVLTSDYRIDTTTETERVLSGDATNMYPTIDTSAGCGATYDSQASLVGVYTGELQKVNGIYRWPANTYTAFVGSTGAGPDYSSAAGNAISGQSGNWRWVTIKFPAVFSNNSAFTLTFIGALAGFSADANQVTANMLLFTKVVGSSGTGWLNANAAYPGSGTPVNDNDAAMVAGSSSSSIKRITFGTQVRTGDLYVRIGIRQTSGLQFGGVSVGSLA
jgi:hypothetical protein